MENTQVSGSVVGWDLYREIHKAMRFALFGVTSRAGNTDPGDDEALTRLLEEWRTVRFVLDGHHAHEDEFCDPLVRAHASEMREELEEAHRWSDARLDELDASADALRMASPAERARQLGEFHLALADFTVGYLTHLAFEERAVMPALNAAMSDEALEAVTAQIRGSVPPPDMCTFIRYMVPAMNHVERVDMLGGMFVGAPPEIFEMFRAAAADCLDADQYQAVATDAGFG